MNEDDYRPAEDVARPGGELIGHELSHVAQQHEDAPDAEQPPAPDDDDRETLSDDVINVAESAAELGFGAVIAPFTGGETVNIVGSMASMLEAGVDRLTHLGERESAPDTGAPADADGTADDGSG
jgi:hypothetical protein